MPSFQYFQPLRFIIKTKIKTKEGEIDETTIKSVKTKNFDV